MGVLHAFTPTTQCKPLIPATRRQRQADLGQPGPQTYKFQDHQGYTEKTFLKSQNQNQKQKPKQKAGKKKKKKKEKGRERKSFF